MILQYNNKILQYGSNMVSFGTSPGPGPTPTEDTLIPKTSMSVNYEEHTTIQLKSIFIEIVPSKDIEINKFAFLDGHSSIFGFTNQTNKYQVSILECADEITTSKVSHQFTVLIDGGNWSKLNPTNNQGEKTDKGIYTGDAYYHGFDLYTPLKLQAGHHYWFPFNGNTSSSNEHYIRYTNSTPAPFKRNIIVIEYNKLESLVNQTTGNIEVALHVTGNYPYKLNGDWV